MSDEGKFIIFCMVINYTCDILMDHKHEITSLKNAVYKMIYTILKTGEYVPPDLDYIADKVRKIDDSEKRHLKIINEDRNLARQEMKRELRRNIINVINKEK